uniref:SHSP18.8 n=1 Tax=Agasicles hygrophila TaxID=715812 RepID=A0A7G8KP64_9CUCU|nr:sHSP18.8 [Agasicles hygrophila]
MSHIPIIFREFLRPLRMMEYQMRQAEELLRPSLNHFNFPRVRLEYPDEAFKEESVVDDKDKFQIKMNLPDFKPEDIAIKSLDGNTLQIEAKHELKNDDQNGYILRQVLRKFVLPKGHDIKNAYSTFSPEGILTVTTPKKMQEIEEKPIPITHESTSQESK